VVWVLAGVATGKGAGVPDVFCGMAPGVGRVGGGALLVGVVDAVEALLEDVAAAGR
jgi:hypothetical protein